MQQVLATLGVLFLIGLVLAAAQGDLAPERAMPALQDVTVTQRPGWTEVSGYLSVPSGATRYDAVTITAAWRGPDGRIIDRTSDLLTDVGPEQRRYWRVSTLAPDAAGVDLACVARWWSSSGEYRYCDPVSIRAGDGVWP